MYGAASTNKPSAVQRPRWGKRSARPTIPPIRGIRAIRGKKFSRFENFRELRPQFPGLGSEDKHYPERENQEPNGKHL